MDLQAEQIRRESEGFEERRQRALDAARTNQAEGKGSVTVAGLRAITEHFEAVEDAVKRFIESDKKGRKSDAYNLLSLMETKQAAFVILRAVLNGAFRTDDDEHISVQALAVEISKGLECNIKRGKRPKQWDDEKRVKAGGWCIGLVAEATDLIQIGTRQSAKFKPIQTVEPSDSLSLNAALYNSVFKPRFEAMVCEPRPWESAKGGGYLTTDDTLIQGKGFHPDQIKNLNLLTAPKVFKAVNMIQAVPWRINRQMLEAVHHLWFEAMETGNYSLFADDLDAIPKKKQKQRIKQLQREMELLLCEADDLAGYERFWLPVYLDYRGRVYYKPVLNPQGSDVVRALLDFADEKPLDDENFFRAYGCRLFTGESDYGKRLDWYDNETMDFDPQAAWWREAKEPLQFLRWCLDWTGYAKERIHKQDYKTGMPCYIDASQSGTQHFAALLRSKELAGQVNLTLGAPRDAYGAVADRLNTLIQQSDDDISRVWREYHFTRSDAKPVVMPIPYQKKDPTYQRDFRIAYRDLIKKHCRTRLERSDATRWLLRQWKRAIRAVLPGIYFIPDWLKAVADAAGQKHIEWPVPSGFMVRQRYFVCKSKRVEVRSYWSRQKFTLQQKTNEVSGRESKQAVVANFIHSLDAAALVETVVRLSGHTLRVAVVHDCFAVAFGDIEWLERAAREGFIQTHYTNLLPQYKIHFERAFGVELPDIPKQGDFDIKLVEKAIYALS